jgi:hypothetical protein
MLAPARLRHVIDVVPRNSRTPDAAGVGSDRRQDVVFDGGLLHES